MGKKVKGALRRLDGSPGQEAALLFPTYTGDAASVPLMHNDVNRLGSAGLTPLHWAVHKRSREAVAQFILSGGDLNVSDGNGARAVDLALVIGQVEMLLFLLDLGADLPTRVEMEDLTEERQLVQNARDLETISFLDSIANQVQNLDLRFFLFSAPLSFARFSETLTQLDLSYNSLLDAPDEMFLLKRLTHLNLSHNLLDQIGVEYEALTMLKWLCIAHNKLRTFPELTKASDKWTNLDISHNLITSIPSEIGRLYRLAHFDCSFNLLSTIPKSIVEIMGLRRLNFSHNQIRHLKDTPFHLYYALEGLNISYNLLEEFPYATIMNSPAIRSFYFSHNRIPTMIYRIMRCYFKKEPSLDLSRLRLKALIPEVKLLTHLKELNVSHNDFEVLPGEIGELVELISLDLSFNTFTDLPLFIHRLSKLQALNLEQTRNHLLHPSKGVVDRGLKSIMGYYFDLLQGEPCYRLKLMFVGQENVGKSTVLHALKNLKLRRRTKRSNISTDGIDIERWSMKTASKQTLTFSAWDFAGQEIYYATHSLFLSATAIYLIVFDLRHPTESRIEFWLNSVASRAASAPVILIGTHLDDPQFKDIEVAQRRLAVLEDSYITHFPNIRQLTAVSATDYEGIASLHDLLGEVGLSMPIIQDPMPKIYQALEDLVLSVKDQENPPAVNWNRFVEIASAKNFKDEEQLLRATHFLNDLGSLVFFEDEATQQRLIVLDPQWLTAMFASVITTSHSYIKNGILKLGDIGQIWRAPQYPQEMHHTLISLLEKFEIIYKLPLDDDGDQPFLLPNLLPEERPPIDLLWADHEPMATQYGRLYTLEFVPNGLFAKLMVRFLHFTDFPLKFWRTGVLAQRGKDKALIELDFKTIKVTIRGETSAQFLRIATEIVDTLVSSWFKVTVTKSEIPCPHCIRVSRDTVGMFSLLECEQAAARQNARFIHCSVDNATVRLDRLVPDIAMTDFQGCEISSAEVELHHLLGKGSYGEIYKGTWRGNSVAVKKIKGGAQLALSVYAEFRREVWLMTGLNHPCIVNLLGFSTSPLMMIMECVTGGDLFGLISNKAIDITWELRLKLAVDMAQGMALLHGINPPLIHRDLKSPNVLVMIPDMDAPVIAKIADFGLSSRLFVDTLTERAVENPTWCAPEVLQKIPYTEKVDVYSYGMILWEMITREMPFNNYRFGHQVETDVVAGVRPSIPSDCWEEYAELISACWAQNPAARPSFLEVIQTLKSMIDEKFGLSKFSYKLDFTLPVSDPTADQVEAPNKSVNARLDKFESLISLPTEGILTKKIEASCVGAINCLVRVTNQVWCAAEDGSIQIFSSESGRFLTSYKESEKPINCLAEVNQKVWSGSRGHVSVYSVEDLVTVDLYDIKVRSGLIGQKIISSKRFGTKKPTLRYCVLYKSGYFRIFQNNAEEEPLYEFFLKNSTFCFDAKGRITFTDLSVEVELHPKEEDIVGWRSDLVAVSRNFSDIPAALESRRKINAAELPLSCILTLENSVLVGCGNTLMILGNDARVQNEIHFTAVLSQGAQVRALLDVAPYIWVAADKSIVRINSTVRKSSG